MKKLGLLLLVSSAIVIAGCDSAASDAAQGAARPAPEVGVVTVQSGALVLTTELPGRTRDFRQAEIRPQVSGILQQRLFTEGEQVSAGQLLYRIDAAPYHAALASAQAALASSKAVAYNAGLKAERLKGLLVKKAVSQQDYDDAKAALMQADAAVASADAQVKSAEINLAYTEIRAPISGRVGRSFVSEGALLTANQSQVLATIRQLDPIYVDLTQSSTELLKLKRHMNASAVETIAVDLLLDDNSQYAHSGTLQFSEVNVDPSSGMVTLRAVFPNTAGDLLPGMFVRARLHHGVDNHAVLVPQAAVSRTPKGQASVLLVNAENKVESRLIEIGRSAGIRWQVLSGLQAGETVVVEGLQKVRPGADVRTVAVGNSQAGASANSAQ